MSRLVSDQVAMDILDEDGQYVLKVPSKEHPEPLCLVLSFSRHLKVTVAETGEGGRVWVRDEIEIYHEMERTRGLKELLRDPGKHCKLDITIESGDDAASSSMRFNIKRIMEGGKRPLVKSQVLELSPRPVQELAGALRASAVVDKHRAEKRLAIADENKKLREQQGDWQNLVDEAVNEKENWQNEMMEKFVRLLNSKKDRIRDLEERLGVVERDSQETESGGQGGDDEMDVDTSHSSEAGSESEDTRGKRRKGEKGRGTMALRAGRAGTTKVKKEEEGGGRKGAPRTRRGGAASIFDPQEGVVYMDAADLEMPASGPSDLAKMPASGPSAKAKRPDTYDASDSSTDDGGGSASPAKPAAPPTQAPGASQTTTKATGKSTGYAGFMADEDEDEEQSNW